VLICGPTGVGKTFLACALAHAAIRHGHSALYLRAPRMFDELAIARADGRLARLMASWARVDVLVIDDFLIRPLSTDQAADLLEIVEDRAQQGATILTSQLPVANWHEALGDPTIADATLDRLLEHANRVELVGDSMRRSDTPARSPEKTVPKP
jgi:DNA replication protein DnaC